jgi:hypothetical protein
MIDWSHFGAICTSFDRMPMMPSTEDRSSTEDLCSTRSNDLAFSIQRIWEIIFDRRTLLPSTEGQFVRPKTSFSLDRRLFRCSSKLPPSILSSTEDQASLDRRTVPSIEDTSFPRSNQDRLSDSSSLFYSTFDRGGPFPSVEPVFFEGHM